MKCAVEPYEGKKPYIFLSYCHKNADVVYPIIEKLAAKGYRIWYDVGSKPGAEWTEVIGQHLSDCAICLAVLTAEAADSHNCCNEIMMSVKDSKPIFIVYLEEVALSIPSRKFLSPLPSFKKYENDSAAFDKVFQGMNFPDCLGEPIPVYHVWNDGEAAREKKLKEQAERERLQREEQARREQAERERLQREEQARREQAERERLQREEQARREQAERERIQREHDAKSIPADDGEEQLHREKMAALECLAQAEAERRTAAEKSFAQAKQTEAERQKTVRAQLEAQKDEEERRHQAAVAALKKLCTEEETLSAENLKKLDERYAAEKQRRAASDEELLKLKAAEQRRHEAAVSASQHVSVSSDENDDLTVRESRRIGFIYVDDPDDEQELTGDATVRMTYKQAVLLQAERGTLSFLKNTGAGKTGKYAATIVQRGERYFLCQGSPSDPQRDKMAELTNPAAFMVGGELFFAAFGMRAKAIEMMGGWTLLYCPASGAVVTLTDMSLVLGRTKPWLDGSPLDKRISRTHALVEKKSNKFYITDRKSDKAGSTNGTSLNGVLLPPLKATELHNGDEIALAERTIAFYDVRHE